MYNASRAAFEKISGDLSQKVDLLTSGLKNLPEKVDSLTVELKNLPDVVVTSHGNAPTTSSDSSSTKEIHMGTLLANLRELPRLDQADFPNLTHWFPTVYRKLRKGVAKTEDTTEGNLLVQEVDASSSDTKSRPKNKDPILSCFLEDKNGDPVSGNEKKAISSMASAYWAFLAEQNRAPESFRKANIQIKLQWRILMEAHFECLRYCDNHWKSEQYWINNYTSWTSNHGREKKPKVKENGPTEATVIDIDDDNEDDSTDVMDIKEVSRSNKRGPPDSGKTSKSKCARVEEPKEPTPLPRPLPTKITTKRARVRALCFSTICITNSL